jgi:hypothetical protein
MEWVRDTTNYRVFETRLSPTRYGIMYLPKAVFGSPGIDNIQFTCILGTRTDEEAAAREREKSRAAQRELAELRAENNALNYKLRKIERVIGELEP